MATTYLSPLGNEQQNDQNGAPLSGGKVWTYAAGTTTLLATYQDNAGSVAQANPIVLNTSGMPASPIWLPAGQAVKMVFTEANGVSSRPTVDNIVGINDPSGISIDQWVIYTGAPTFLSATTFSVAGDQRNTFQAGRRVRTVNSGGTVYGSITGVAFGAVTTVTVANDSGVLDSGLSQVSYGLLSATNPSVPPGRLLGVQVFSATGTYTPTPGTTSVVVEVVGGGGAGGGSPVTGAGAVGVTGGGGSGAYSKSRIASAFAGVTVTVGAGGAPGAAGAIGGNGGASSFGALVSAPGGSGGSVGASFSSAAYFGGAAGGAVATGGNIVNAPGAAGGVGTVLTTTSFSSGEGGASEFGPGAARTVSSGASQTGTAAVSPGAGGSGAVSGASSAAQVGGAGAAGKVIVYEYA